MHLQTRAWRPVGVTAVGPGLQAPAWVEEGRWLGDIFRAVHVAEHGEDLGFCGIVVLGFDDVGLGGDDGDEQDARAGEEAGPVEGLEDWVVAALVRIGVEEELRRCVPEDLVGWELHEDFRVGAH